MFLAEVVILILRPLASTRVTVCMLKCQAFLVMFRALDLLLPVRATFPVILSFLDMGLIDFN